MDNRWYRLLSYWQDHELNHSLTFSFLIGALRNPIGATKGHETSGRTELEDLIDEIRTHPVKDVVFHVYRCGDRNKLVITRIRGTQAPPYAAAIPPSSDDKTPVLFFSSCNSTNGRTGLDDLIEAIWDESGKAIEQGLFSCRGRIFQYFDDDELRVIRAAFA